MQTSARSTVNPVSESLEKLLRESGMSQAELARRLGLPRSSVSRLFNPAYQGHTVGTLKRVAEAVGARLEIGFSFD